MELLPRELTAIPVPHVALLGHPEIWPRLTQALNQQALPTTTRDSLSGPVGDLHARLPRFHVSGNRFKEWEQKWLSENVMTNSTVEGRKNINDLNTGSSPQDLRERRGLLPLSWFRRIVHHTPPVILVALDFRAYPVQPHHLWTPAQAAVAAKIKTEASRMVLECRLAVQHYFDTRNVTSEVEDPTGTLKCAIPKLIFMLVFGLNPGDNVMSEEAIKTQSLDAHGLIAALNVDGMNEVSYWSLKSVRLPRIFQHIMALGDENILLLCD